jgi:signal transduction histidine kinase
MRTFLGVPVVGRGEAYGNLSLTEKQGGAPFDESDEQAATLLAEWASIAIENARLYQRAEGRRSELERTVRGLETRTGIAHALGGETQLGRVLELVAKRARALVEARSLAILLVEEGGDLVVAAVAGELPASAREVLVPRDSLPGRVLASGRPERLGDLSTRLAHSLEALGLQTGSALLVPLVFRGEPQGVVCAFDRLLRGPEFHGDDERLLVSFADAAATAVATARSVERERLTHRIQAQEAERRRWARELHDETLQGLAGLQMILRTALQAGSQERLDSAARIAVEHIGAEIEGLRSIIADLRPAALDELGVGAALRGLAERSQAMSGMAVELELDLPSEGPDWRRLEPQLEATVYRLVQEGLTNAAKHSGAKRVRVAVSERESTVEVTVADDGRGFEPARGTDGFGLAGMQERVALAGGFLTVASSPGEGTTLSATMPIRRRAVDVESAAG